jgi:hypothetical protein
LARVAHNQHKVLIRSFRQLHQPLVAVVVFTTKYCPTQAVQAAVVVVMIHPQPARVLLALLIKVMQVVTQQEPTVWRIAVAVVVVRVLLELMR